MKNKYIIAILVTLGTIFPIHIQAASDAPEVVAIETNEEIRITVKGLNVRVQNATNLKLEVFSLTGMKVAEYKIDAADKTISLNVGKGLFVLKVGNLTRKVSIL